MIDYHLKISSVIAALDTKVKELSAELESSKRYLKVVTVERDQYRRSLDAELDKSPPADELARVTKLWEESVTYQETVMRPRMITAENKLRRMGEVIKELARAYEK